MPHVIHRLEYQRMLKEQVQAVLDKLHANEYETISAYLNDSYTDAFVGTVYAMHQQDIPIILPVNPEAIVRAVMIDTKLQKPLYESLGVDLKKLKATISGEITRGIATGRPYSEIARNIANATNVPLRRAKTIVRTEAGRIQEQAAMSAAEKAKAKGADVVKQWCAILDGKTRPSHRRLDKQTREVDEPFEMDGKQAMQPHGFNDPAEDCNCRCILLIKARGRMDAEELANMRKRAEFFGLDKTEDFKEFKKKYMKISE